MKKNYDVRRVLHVRYRRSWNLRTRLKTTVVQMWSLWTNFQRHLWSHLDIGLIYTVPGPNKHSQDALI